MLGLSVQGIGVLLQNNLYQGGVPAPEQGRPGKRHCGESVLIAYVSPVPHSVLGNNRQL